MNQRLLEAFLCNDLDAIKSISMIIAHEVRNNIEDFHVEHLSDEQMRKLNPLIREGILNALFAIVNYDRDPFARDFVDFHVRSIPGYWETPKLHSKFLETALRLSDQGLIKFKSQFLKEQYESGNIFVLPKTSFIRIKGSFEFTGVEGDKNTHRNKISSHLRKEGFRFNPTIDAYSKAQENL